MRAASRAGFDRQLARFQTRLRTRNADTDQYRHINNAVIASFFEEARMAIFLQDDLAACMREKRVAVAHREIDFLKEMLDRKSTRLNSSHKRETRMPSSAGTKK